jgi:hypothetical protein
VDRTRGPLLVAGHVLASNETELYQEQKEKNRQSCSSDLHLLSFPRIARNMYGFYLFNCSFLFVVFRRCYQLAQMAFNGRLT